MVVSMAVIALNPVIVGSSRSQRSRRNNPYDGSFSTMILSPWSLKYNVQTLRYWSIFSYRNHWKPALTHLLCNVMQCTYLVFKTYNNRLTTYILKKRNPKVKTFHSLAPCKGICDSITKDETVFANFIFFIFGLFP